MRLITKLSTSLALLFFLAPSLHATCMELEGQTNCDNTLTVGGKFAAGASTVSAQATINSLNPGTTVQIDQCASSPTADNQEWTDSTGLVKAKVDCTGLITANGGFSGDGSKLTNVALTPTSTVYVQTNPLSQQTSAANISSGTVQTLNTTTLNVSGEIKLNLTSGTSGQLIIPQGSGVNPKFQWDGRINGPDVYSISGTTSTTTTATLGANTSLTGTHTTLSAGEQVEIKVSATCQVAASDGGSVGVKRGSTVVGVGTAGAFRLGGFGANAAETSCNFTTYDTPGSVGTFTYTVVFNSSSGGTLQFGEGSRASYLSILGYPK